MGTSAGSHDRVNSKKLARQSGFRSEANNKAAGCRLTITASLISASNWCQEGHCRPWVHRGGAGEEGAFDDPGSDRLASGNIESVSRAAQCGLPVSRTIMVSLVGASSRADHQFAHIHIGWLLDGISDGARDGFGWNGNATEIVHGRPCALIRDALGQFRFGDTG